MKTGIKCLLGFVSGALVGGLVSYAILKKKLEKEFEERIDFEIKSMKSTYIKNADRTEKTAHDIDISDRAQEKPALDDLTESIISKMSSDEKKEYINYANMYKPSSDKEIVEKAVDEPKETVEKEKTSKNKKPYVISPEEFQSVDDYETIWLTYYADGVLADERDNKVDIASTIGKKALEHFGEYERDVVYVRNDKVKCDYEISRDNRTFKEVIGEVESDDEDEED